MKKRYIWMLSMLLLFSFLMFTACSKEKEQAGKEEKAEVEIPEFKDEIYGDPDIFDSPRIQFYWEAPGDGKRTLWSTKLDGTDLRRSIPLNLDTFGITHPPVRSPDNRYIIASKPVKDAGVTKRLYDLKTKTFKEIANGGGKPCFQWTQDSKYIIFYLDGELVKYSIKDDKIIKMPEIYSRGLYLLNDNKGFLAIERRGYKFYSVEGELLKSSILVSEENDGELSPAHAATNDGKYIMYYLDAYYIIDTEDQNKVIYKDDDNFRTIGPYVFGPYGKNIYYSTGIIKKLNAETGTIDIAVRLDYLIGTPGSQNPIIYPSIINTKEVK